MKTVLSIDGGGIKGVIPALVLAEIEARTGNSIAKDIDLLAGTSTGGIIALGLSKDSGDGRPQYTAQDLADWYINHGKEFFPHSMWRTVSSVGGLFDEEYCAKGLEKFLAGKFEQSTLGQSLKPTFVTTYDIHYRRPFFFKSWQQNSADVPMHQAARATSAAPTYYEPAQVDVNGSTRSLVDGGVFINNPALSAYLEAKKLYPEDDIKILSLGTGEQNPPIPYQSAKDWGKAGWLNPLISCIFDGTSDVSNYQLKTLIGDSFIRLQQEISHASNEIDDATGSNLQRLCEEARELIHREDEALDKVAQWLTA